MLHLSSRVFCEPSRNRGTGNSMTRGTVQLRWPEVAMEVSCVGWGCRTKKESCRSLEIDLGCFLCIPLIGNRGICKASEIWVL